MSAFGGKADIGCPFHRIRSRAGGACYFFVIIVIRHETTAAAPWALLLIVRTLFNDPITIAVWTGFHACLPVDHLRGPNPPRTSIQLDVGVLDHLSPEGKLRLDEVA
jgi:hypothetical protein